MNINIIKNQIIDQITNLIQEYNNRIDQDQSVKKVNAKIRAVFKEGFAQIEQYLATNPVTKPDLEALQKFRDDLVEVYQISTNIGLEKFNTTIKKIQLTGTDKAYFQSRPTLKDRVGFLLDKFKNFFVRGIRTKINRQIFFIWNQKLRFNSRLQKIVKLNEEIPKLEARVAEAPGDNKLKKQLDNKRAELKRTEKFVAEYEKNLGAAERTRKQFESIGGTRLALQTKDGETLDGTYLSAQSFQQKCIDAEAKQVKISVPVDGTNAEIPGLLLPKGGECCKFIKTLEQLKLFKDFHQDLSASNKGGGWTKVNIGDQVAIVPDFEVEQLMKKGVITEKVLKEDVSEKGESKVREVSYSFADSVSKDVKLDTKPLEINPKKSGTVVMGMGAAGVYEMAKREAVSLLMQGTNVMLFNHRGQGASTGKPSEKGTYEDMETVYQYLKQVHNAEDEKLVFRGLCLSGGIVSELASRHPKVNVVLDQTYAEISDISLDTVLDSVKDILNYKHENSGAIKKAIISGLTPILRAFTALVSPDFKTADHLKHVQGKILVLRATEDTYTSNEMSDKILKIYARNSSPEKSAQVRVGHMPGIHGSPWLDARKSHGDGQKVDLGRYHILSFLQEAGALNPFVDEGNTLQEISNDYTSYLQSHAQAMKAFEKTMQALPEKLEDVPKEMTQLPLQDVEAVKKAQTVESPQLPNVIDGKRQFDTVLKELDRLKDKLGGSPHFGASGPRLDDVDAGKTFFGVPMPAVKDWFSMVLKKHWRPKPFWKAMAGIFHVSLDVSQYEEAHTRIQRFGMLVANKERFNEILDKQDQSRYGELLKITGMMWHPKDNGWGTEKTYVQFIEKFLIEDFEAAKAKGDDALVEYFKAFDGVCFEDRCRHLEEYAALHPTDQEIAAVTEVLEEIVDVNFDLPVSKAFDEIGSKLIGKGEEVSALAVLEDARKHILGRDFATNSGAKAKATLQDFQDYAVNMMIADMMIMEPYPSVEDLLKVELEILKGSGQEVNADNFKKQLTRLDGQGIISSGDFSTSDPAIETFIRSNLAA